MRIDVLTLFPELFPGPLGASVIGRAVERGLVEIAAVKLRDFAVDARGTVDDKPYGGGPGMLMLPEVCTRAVEAVRRPGSLVVLTSPRGEPFSQRIAAELAKQEHLVIVAPHYEGVDQRAIDLAVDREISIGDYVLSGGTLAAMVIADAVIRLLPGALGDDESSADDSFSAGLLEYPQYTRPEEFRGLRVPEVLLSGDRIYGKSICNKRKRFEMNILDKIRNEQVRADRAEFGIGDTVKVSVKIVEGDNERIQAFQGTVIARHGSGVEETFTVRRVQAGQGVERVFPINSPRIEKIEVVRRGDVRRAKLYYLRSKIGKAARVKELRTK